MTGETLSCLLCDQSAIWETGPRTGNWLITCPYCGPFTVSEAVEEDIRADKDAPGLVPFLSAYVRQTATRRGKWAIVGNDWKAHAAAHAATRESRVVFASVEEKKDRKPSAAGKDGDLECLRGGAGGR